MVLCCLVPKFAPTVILSSKMSPQSHVGPGSDFPASGSDSIENFSNCMSDRTLQGVSAQWSTLIGSVIRGNSEGQSDVADVLLDSDDVVAAESVGATPVCGPPHAAI